MIRYFFVIYFILISFICSSQLLNKELNLKYSQDTTYHYKCPILEEIGYKQPFAFGYDINAPQFKSYLNEIYLDKYKKKLSRDKSSFYYQAILRGDKYCLSEIELLIKDEKQWNKIREFLNSKGFQNNTERNCARNCVDYIYYDDKFIYTLEGLNSFYSDGYGSFKVEALDFLTVRSEYDEFSKVEEIYLPITSSVALDNLDCILSALYIRQPNKSSVIMNVFVDGTNWIHANKIEFLLGNGDIISYDLLNPQRKYKTNNCENKLEVSSSAELRKADIDKIVNSTITKVKLSNENVNIQFQMTHSQKYKLRVLKYYLDNNLSTK